ncbi:unnamed protein product [Oikopleura dioica]|uniref:Structural maintenance of chromosomes protein n=1 Tax=Oikopleura dioica TaxID=34765 RepID=E4XMU3_OIKDI|nr:unnamed protein product [Oikopleura dioica]
MHIKEVRIQGFRSYRDSTCDVFSPHQTSFRRSSSCFPTNTRICAQNSVSRYFMKGSGPRVITAFVEIVFDNSDRRLPMSKDEVVLRRTVGQKKDQFFIDKKNVTKKDVVQMLESAGFSHANPYYIVKQGKINEMATQSEKDRLELLKEIAGTRVYDDKRGESMELIRKTNDNRSKVNTLLTQIVEKLDSLEREKEDLAEYQKFDREKRAFEFLIFENQRKEAETKLKKLKLQREQKRETKADIREKSETLRKQLQEAKKNLSDVEHALARSSDEKESVTSEKEKLISSKTKHELEIKELKLSENEGNASAQDAEKELKELKVKIREKRHELEQELTPEFQRLKALEDGLHRETQNLERKKEELYAKQGRNTRFVDQQSRDSWIKKEINQLEGHIAARQNDLEREQEDTARLRRENSERDDAISRCRREREAHKSKWEEKNDALLQMKREKDELANKQNEHWREQTKLQGDKSQLADDMRNKESKLQGMIGRSTLDGINALKRVRARFQQQNNQRLVDGYLGSLIDCFETDQAFFTAVEVTAGGRLFNHIVTDASIGTAYLDEMNRMKLSGEVTFLPLDRLVASKENYPTDTKDALPLIDKLRFGDRYKIAMRYVFGKTLICRNIEVASKYARNKGFDCITLDGDQVSRRGALTGGYIDTSRSRLELHHLKKQHEEQIYALEDDLQRSKEDMQQFDKKMNKIQREIQNYDADLSKCKDQFDRSSRMFTQKREEYTQYLKSIESREESINHLMQQLESLSSDKKALESELGSAMASQLTQQEQEDLRRFAEAVKEKSKEFQEMTQMRIDVEKKKTRVEGILKDNLLKREAFLEAGMNSMEGDERRSRLTEAIDKVNTTQLGQCAERESELVLYIRQHEQDRDQMFKVVEEFKRQQNHFSQELFEADKQVDTMAAKESIYIDKQKNSEKKILDLGSVPNDLIQNYADQSTKHLYKKLEDAQKALKNYGHVNKQALDQFMAFSEERARLERRRNELDGESEKITELVNYLDVKKFEAIESSFNDISKNFALVFSKLVPQGSAHLEMKEDSRKDPTKFSKVEMLSGILIKVSFSGQAAETREMSQLSGGQKSMVALTLIFAIQKCDPVPFYLFDEIDQALDPGHRRAVSEMMNEMKHDAQFITTTFRPELLESGDKFYGVTYRNKVSHVNTITKSVALDFVEDDKINS